MSGVGWCVQAVSDVKCAGVDVSLAIQDVRQRYETLTSYKQPVTADELRQVRALPALWDAVRHKAHYTSFTLVTVKSKFTSLAQLEISGFADEIRQLRILHVLHAPVCCWLSYA